MSKELKVLKEIIKAWETIKGNERYSPSDIQDWLVNDMAPAINKARKVIKSKK